MRHLCPWRPKQSEEEPVIAVNLNQAIQIFLSVHQVHIHCHSNRPTVMRVFLRGHQPLKGATKEWLLLIFHIASELDQASKFISVDSFEPMGFSVYDCICVHIRQTTCKKTCQLHVGTAGMKNGTRPKDDQQKGGRGTNGLRHGMNYPPRYILDPPYNTKDVKQLGRFSVKSLHHNFHKI